MALSVISLRCGIWSAVGAYRTSSSNQARFMGTHLRRDRSTDRDSFGSPGNTLPGTGGNRGGANDCSRGGSLLWSCNWEWLVIAGSPATAYHPGTEVADHRDMEEAVTRVLDASAVG